MPEQTLVGIYDRWKPPFAYTYQQGAGDETYRVYPGEEPARKTPNVWELDSCLIAYVASADVANRVFTINCRNALAGGSVLSIQNTSTPITANQAKNIQVVKAGLVGAIGFSDFYAGISEGAFVISEPGDWFQLTISNGHANDTVEVRIRWKFRNFELGMIDPFR